MVKVVHLVLIASDLMDLEGHTCFQVLGHLGKIVAFIVHSEALSSGSLAYSDTVTSQGVSIGVEIDLEVDGLMGVDVTAGPVGEITLFVYIKS